ncbi:Os05g0149701 [Oryza sativa Japonica Group]|uniref:Os05g0149701 protein n=1 Tax=Oryza sativa subsp. japonica TaxID=39947 RepID=A0A0P0WI09_ORYSJ|nr:hypothetical protein EE612_027122 [Oryza sativa]BAS92290.1 Os05g0149701 [Oryza sativa Japonica Group]
MAKVFIIHLFSTCSIINNAIFSETNPHGIKIISIKQKFRLFLPFKPVLCQFLNSIANGSIFSCAPSYKNLEWHQLPYSSVGAP